MICDRISKLKIKHRKLSLHLGVKSRARQLRYMVRDIDEDDLQDTRSPERGGSSASTLPTYYAPWRLSID
jgi:hypothetical protein